MKGTIKKYLVTQHISYFKDSFLYGIDRFSNMSNFTTGTTKNKNKNHNTTNLNDLLERTRRQLLIREEEQTKNNIRSTNTTIFTPSNSSNIILPSNPPQQQQQQQQLSNDVMTKTLAQEMGIPEPKILDQDDYDNNDGFTKKEEIKPCLIDTVLERQYPPIVMDVNQTSKNTSMNHESIEGYTPKTTTNDDTTTDSTKQQPTTSSIEQTTEIDMNFTCMTSQEYKDTCQLAQSMGMTIKQFMECTDQLQEKEDHDDPQEPISLEEKKEESKFISGVQFYHSNDHNDDNDDDDDILDFWSPNDNDSEEEEEEEERPLRTFMIFWNALMEWITPQAMDVLFQKKEKGQNYLVELYDTSDVGASRCAGFMTMLKMNMSRSCRELQINASTSTQVQSKLTQWIRSFDFSRPMIKLSIPQWKAFTTILVQIVMTSSSTTKTKTPPKVLVIPPSVNAADITLDEYIYLTQSAMKSLQRGSA